MGSSQTALLELKNICVAQQQQKVLDSVDLAFFAGELHVIASKQSEDKSMLCKALSGQSQVTSGQIFWNGIPIHMNSPERALTQGIHTVHRRPTLIDKFTIAENFCFPYSYGLLTPWNKNHALKNAAEYILKYGLGVDPYAQQSQYRQQELNWICLLKAIYHTPKMIVLEDTFEHLHSKQKELVWKLLREQISLGCALVIFTQSFEFFDIPLYRISILRSGRLILTTSNVDMTRSKMISLCYDEEDIHQQHSLQNILVFLETLLKRFPINALAVDENGKITTINNQARDFFKLTASQKIIDIRQLFKVLGEQVLSTLLEVLNRRERDSFYRKSFDFHSQSYIVDFRIFALAEGSQHLGHVITFVDMSEQEHMKAHIQLSEELASVGLLAAGVAHEINNPLEILYNDISYLRYKYNHENDLVEHLNQIEHQAKHIQEIVANLVNFSGDQLVEQEVFDIISLISEVFKLIKTNAHERNIRIQLLASIEQAWVLAQRNEIKQVVLNISKNAFEAMPEGGEFNVSMTQREGEVVLTFEDTGCGLQDPDNVFMPFYSTKKGNGKNMGLGMSIIYGIVKKHGGRILAQNRDAGGCRVTVALPLAQV
jgi:signal transduction histidine kinase/ABC-type iron transport system FetAB ATPase subunit